MGRVKIPNKLIQYLLVAFILAVIVLILLPSLGRRIDGSRRPCIASLRNQYMAFAFYNMDYNGVWPSSGAKLGSLCEQSLETRDALTQMMGKPGATKIGALQKGFYCDYNPQQEPAKLWDRGGVSVWGYVWLNQRNVAVTFPADDPSLALFARLTDQPSDQILALDVIVSDTNSGTINYASPSTAVPFGSSHMSGARPWEANVLFLDGHAERRAFDEKKAVAVKQPGGGYFWFPNP